MAFEDYSSNPSPSFPEYPPMIMAAIEGLNEKEGSNKSAISNYIESNYSDLPPAHSTLLSNALEKMKQSGQLVFLKNNYLKPDPNTPAKRGRGRPPKPKVPLPPGVVPAPPRPRGRPPKPRDPLSPAAPPKKKASSGTGRPRGRPRKIPRDGTVSASASATGVKRGRGRPRKT